LAVDPITSIPALIPMITKGGLNADAASKSNAPLTFVLM